MTAYVASPIKRARASRSEMEARAEALLEIAEEMQPCTVRQVFYQATVRGIVEKTEAGYAKVQRLLADMRRAGELPWGWIADNTRWQRKPRTWDSLEDALEDTARLYRTLAVDGRAPPTSRSGSRRTRWPAWSTR